MTRPTAETRMFGTWVPGESVVEIVDTGYQDLVLPFDDDVPGPLEDKPQPARPRVSPDRRRTERQQADVEAGRNPLTRSPKHPEAPDDATRRDRFARPFTCGTCIYLIQMGAGNKTFLKCGWTNGGPGLPSHRGPRITGSVASDVRKWWPACPDYESH